MPGVGVGTRYKFRILGPDGVWREKSDPMAFATEVPPATASVVHGAAPRVGRRRVAGSGAREHRRTREPMSVYEVHLGSWRPGLGYREMADAARRVPGRDRLHPRRAAAGGRAPVRRVVGLPGHLLLRADRAVRHPGRLPLLRRHAAPGRLRRDRRLGAGALPEGRLGAGPLRRHPALRARRPAPRRAARLGHATCSTSAAARCATSSSRTPCTGSRSSTSTACGWTPSPRCSTSTTPAPRASGCPTSTAAGRTWTRWRSCRR